ncbi:MAG: hypothetical protein NZM29_07090 [Nitrospira sp.]|nr:hypothetical protein [Nitrospira sp.]
MSDQRSLYGILATAALLCCFIPSVAAATDDVSPAIMYDVVSRHSSQLAAIDSDTAAMTLFTSTIGPSLGLQDTAGILSAKGLSPKVAQELGLSELSRSVYELMTALAAWRLAESIYRAPSTADPTSSAQFPPAQVQQEWLSRTSSLAGLADLFKRLSDQPSPETIVSSSSPSVSPELVLAALETARQAQQQALASWWSLRDWKNRVRQTRGLARLCGTWQWIIHNHQNHQEQKLTMVFPPPGQKATQNPLPVETVILGDSIYLRWEDRGFVQEDSLLFVTEGHKRDALNDAAKIEGSFLNNRGGWGPISAKRLANCQS